MLPALRIAGWTIYGRAAHLGRAAGTIQTGGIDRDGQRSSCTWSLRNDGCQIVAIQDRAAARDATDVHPQRILQCPDRVCSVGNRGRVPRGDGDGRESGVESI